MADFVDDLNLESGKASNPSSFVDDLDLTEKPKPSLWDRAKSAVGMGEEAPKREMTVNPSSVTAAPQQEPAHGPMTAAVRLIQGVRDQKSEPLLLTKDAAGSAFIRTMSRVPENLLASGVKAVKGQAGVSVVDQDLGNRLVSWVEERNKALAKEYSDKGMISKRDVAELGPNLGFSGISMGAGILGGMGGGVAGSFLPGPGNVAGAVSGSMAASGTVAYRMQTYSAMMDWLTKINKESIAQTGKPITPAEEKKFKEHFDKLASESGLWEAGPEAVGNVLEIALMAGKGTLPGRLASLLPKGVAGKAIKGVARAAGIVGTEEATETITQHGQHNVEVKAGMSKEPIREWTSGDDLLKSAGDVLPGVLLLSGFMTGGGAIYRKAAGKNKTKQLSSPEELSKPAEVKAEEQPFVDDINISEEEVSPNATAEGKKPEGDIGEHSGTDRVGEAAGSGGSDITEPSGEVKEAPKVEPRRIIDDILKDLDEVQGQQAEIEKAKDAGIAVSPEKEVAVEQKADDLKTELADAVREERSVEEQKPSNDTEATTESKADNSQNVTPVTQNVTAGQSENVATLPPDISKSAPKYSYREKQFNIEFPDDVTKAAYIVRNSKKLSAKDAGFMSFLRSQYPEKTDEQIRALGESIKSDLTTQAKTAKHNTTLKVNSIIQEKENVDPAGQSDKIETDEVDFYDRPDSKKILDEAGTEGHEAADIAASLREGEEIGDSEGAILSPREVEAKVEKLAEELGVEKPSKRQAKRQPKNQKTEKEATNLAQFLVKAGKVRLGSFSSRTGTAWDRAHGMRGKDESRELGVIKAVASKNGKMSMDEAADYVNAEGFKDRNGKPFTDVTLFEELAYGDSRNVLHPELAESKIDKEIERQENEWIAEQLRKQGEEVDASAVEESRSDIEAGLLGSLEEEGYSSEQIEENAREVEDFFASVTKNNLEKPAESATIPDVTTPKGTASDIPAKTTPQAEAGLIQEAKKYKTVEEFVNAQGIEAWHGSRHKIEGELSLARGGEQGGDITKNGFTFSTQDVAEKYRYSGLSRDELVKMFGEADAKAIEDRTSILHGRIKMENPLLVDASGYDYKSKHYTDQKEGLRSKAFTEYIKQMEDGGHDGIIFTNVKDTPGKKADTTVYFIKDKNKFKTEEQLTHIWNKAHQLPNPSRSPEGTASDIPAKTTPQVEAGNPFKDSVVKEPLYRGDTIAVEEFDKSKITNADFRAFFFTEDKTYAPIYAHHKPKGVLESNLSPTVRQAYINLKKPLDLRDKLSDHPDLEIIDKELYTYFQKRNTVGDFLESVVQEKTSKIEQQPFQGLNALLDGSEEGAKKYRESYNRIIKDRGFDTSGDYENARDTIEYLRRFRREASFEITDVIESLGYDGLIRPETFNKFGGPNSKGDVSYAVFNNDQIKLLPNQSRPPEVGGQSAKLSSEEVKSKQTVIPGASYSETFSLTNPETEISKPLPEQVTPKNQDLFGEKNKSEAKKEESSEYLYKEIIPYSKDLKITNIDSLSKGTGARYLLTIKGDNGVLIAKQWRRTVPRPMNKIEVLVDFESKSEAKESPIVQKLLSIKDKLSTITSRDEAAEIDKSISREIYDEIKRYDSALAYNLMKKAEAGLPAALSLNKGIKDGKTTLHQMDVKDLNEVLDRAINLLSNDKGPQIVKTESQKIEDQGGTDDSGVELAYNKRNRIKTGIKWADVKDKNTALRVKEVTKSNVYPKPDYQQMVADGMHPMSAYLVKTVYDSIPPTPVIGSRTITDEDMQRYITAVNRVMDGVTVWANDKEAIKAWASKQASVVGAMLGRVTSITDLAKADKSLLGMVYPDGYKNHMEEIRILGGRSILQGLQPGYEQSRKAIKEIEKGWPGKIESWQRQGYAVIERKNIKVPEGWTDSKDNPIYMTEINGRTFGERYGSREDAQAAIDKMQPFILVDKYSRPVSEHETLEEAQEAARVKVKREGGKTINEKGISVESAERVGETRRKEGENITSDRLRETFGFKGVNFGNWMKGNANEAERQLHLNHAYDSFMDLAELLNVPPEALSLNGMLGVAIGAQGSGAAAAHFVPGVNEINLTRTAGAGAIAHEWAHALDHYFGTQAGLSAAKHPYLTENKPIGENIRPEIVSLFNKIVHTMNHKTLTITPEEQARQDETRKQQAKGNVESWLKSIRGDYINNGIDEQAFDAIANRIRNMELGDGRVSVSGYFSMSPAVSELRNLYKEKTGRTYSLDQIKGLQTNIDHYKYLSEKDQTDHVPQTRETYSDYALEAGRLDKGKKKDYWNTNREKFARAFDAFITDSISEKEAKNTYLSGIEAAPPKGEERKTINQAFRELVDEIKTRETENGLMLFDNEGNYDIIKAKKAGLVDDETIQRIENYGNEISTSKRGNLDSTVRASKIPADFTKQGFVDLRGQRIESPRDLAAICQIFRDPQVETLRYFYLKDGVIVGHEGISSRMPGFVSFFPTGQFAKNIMKMIGRARRLKADEIYMLHNHPSGVPKPSDEDMRATATLSGNLYLKSKEDGRGTIKLSTHVIIDHKKYGVITPKPSFGKKGNIEGISVNRYISDLPEGKEYGPPSVPHELLGAKITDQDDLANIGKLVKSPKNYATLIFRDGNGKVSGIQDVHVGMLKGKDADGYLRARARDFGAQNIFAHVLDIEEIGESRVRELIKNGSLLDVSWGNKAASESGVRKRLGYVFGKKISDYGSMRVHEWSNVENLTENQREARKRIERNLSIMGDEAQKAGVSIEDYMKATGMSEGQVTRLMEYAKAQPVEAPEGYREVLPDEVLPAGSDVNMDFISGKSFVKVKDTTGVKHAAIEEERVKAGKEPVIKQEPRGNEGMFQAAKAAVDSGEIKPRLLAQEVAKKPRPITTEEEFALMYDRMRIKNELRDIQRQIDTAQQDKNSQMEADLLERRTAIESDLDTNDQATTHGGSEVGRSLQARTRMINEDYSLEEILLRARQDNGGTLSEEMRKKYEALAREIEEANEKIKAYEEKIASLEAKRSFQRMKNDDVIIRHLGQAKEKRASAKKALDDEFSQLTKQLNAALGGIHMNFDPTAVKILALMAKNRIKAGILTPDGIVNEIYEQVHESYPEVEKRDIRDAISGYGRTLQLSKDEIDVQLREAKRLMRLISSYEDASSGQVPLRSGMQRDKMTNEVRELGRRVRQAMREAGIDLESSLSPEEQWKTSLDAVKTRLRNQIHDIKQQIETGEKSPKKIGIKYDEEAEALRAQRDKLKDILISIEGKPGMSPEQKINLAMAAVEKSIAEYERRISEKDLAPKKQGTGSPETPELKSLRDRRDELRAIYKEMQKEAKPKKTPKEIALQSYKTRMKNRIKELEEKLEKKDFAEKPKRELRLDDEGLTLKHNLDRAISRLNEARLKDQLARRNWLQKFIGGTAETANFMRSVKASMDVSAVFRQGLFTVVSHPVVGAKALPAMFKAFKNDKYRFAVEQDILNRPNYKLYKDAGLDLTDIGTDLSKMEETFMSRLAEKIPGVAGSQRAYTTFLNKIRVDTFDLLIKNLVKSEGKHTPEEAKAIATLINESTGRGKVGMKPNTLSGLNTIFFAPRLVASRFQILAGHSMWKGTKASRKLIAKEYGRFLAGMSVVYLLAQLAGFDIEWDQRSSDFGKIKIGNTRIDPMGGFAQVIVFSSRVISGKTKSSSGVIKPIRGDVQYGQGNTADVIWRFLRTKLAPAVSVSIDALTGTDVVGNKVTVFNPDELKAPETVTDIPKQIGKVSSLPEKTVAPMAIVDTYEAMRDRGIPQGLAIGALGMLGVGIQTYEKDTKQKLKDDLRDAIKSEDQEAIDTAKEAISDASDNELITERDKKRILKDAKDDAFVSAAKKMPLPALAEMIKEDATDDQKEALHDIFKKKIDRARQERRIDSETQDRYYEILEEMR